MVVTSRNSRNRARLGALVTSARKKRNLTQAELAQAADVSPRSIVNVENGVKVSPKTLALVELALQLPAGEFDRALNGDETRSDEPSQSQRRYSDPQEQALWDLEALPEDTRLELIAYLRARRGLQTG